MKRAIVGLVIGLAGLGNGCLAADNKIAPDLRNTPGGTEVDVIVQYAVPPAAPQERAVVATGGKVQQRLTTIQALLARTRRQDLDTLAQDPNVI